MLQEILESSVLLFRESECRVLSQSFYRLSKNHSVQLRSFIVLLPGICVDWVGIMPHKYIQSSPPVVFTAAFEPLP